MSHLRRSETSAIVALVIASAVGLSVVALSIGAAVTEARALTHVSEQASTLLATTLGALVGALSAYLGLRGDPSPPPGDEPIEPPPHVGLPSVLAVDEDTAVIPPDHEGGSNA